MRLDVAQLEVRAEDLRQGLDARGDEHHAGNRKAAGHGNAQHVRDNGQGIALLATAKGKDDDLRRNGNNEQGGDDRVEVDVVRAGRVHHIEHKRHDAQQADNGVEDASCPHGLLGRSH